MNKDILEYLRRFWLSVSGPERRYHAKPVEVNRRGSDRLTMREAEKTLQISLDDLKRVVGAADDRQQRVVIWSTFWPTCTYGRTEGALRYCANPSHLNAGFDAICDEDQCPILNGALPA